VARYLRDGRRDRSFARDGLQVTPFVNGGSITAIALRRDGRIVVAGSVRTQDNRDLFAVARYRRDGRLDRSFSGDGVQTTAMAHRAMAFDLALQADGRIVVAGLVDTVNEPGTPGALRFALARYSRDGRLDHSFSEDGIALGPPGYATAVAIQRDGRIVAAGGDAQAEFALVRYLPDGRLDPAFSGDGEQTTAISPGVGADLATALALARDGRIVVAGVTQTHVYPVDDLSGHDFAIARYLPDGRLDASFSADGVQTTHFGDGGSEARALVLEPDGRLVAGGIAQDPGGGQDRFALARYTAR
jgi:uncharacterized delta-60 repeat protein